MGSTAASAADKDDASPDFAVTVASLPPWLDGRPANDAVDLGSGAVTVTGEDDGPPAIPQIGRYLLKQRLGEGGLGTVYEAWDPVLSRTVAVKTLHFNRALPDRVALDRQFLNEARAVAGLNHPHIVTVHDAGLSAHGVYIAMERLQGRDLRQALATGWLPTAPQAAQLVRRVADALAYAHARGVVHCDIKPANVFLTRRDRPTVLDFGIARVAHRAQPGPVGGPTGDTGTVAGSPHYLAPEQLQGGAVDQRTDVYALGVVLYELLAGRKAFEGGSLAQIVTAVLHGNPAPAHEIRTAVPPGLAAVAARAMARDPAQRYASATDLALALRPWQERAPQDEAPGQTLALPASAPSTQPVRRPRWLRWGLPVLGVCFAGAVVLGLSTRGKDPADAAATVGPPAAATAAAVAEPAVASIVETAGPAPMPSDGPPTGAAEANAGGTTSGGLPPDVAVPSAALPAAPSQPVKRPSRVTQTKTTPPKTAVQTAPAPVTAPATGVLRVAVSPWGEIEVDGRPAGITPPVVQLTLSEGPHDIVIRNGDFPPFTTRVVVGADQPTLIKHRFGP